MQEKFKVTNDRQAEWVIEKANEDLTEISRFKESLEERLGEIREKLNKLHEEENKVKEWRDSYLAEYFETTPKEYKKKTKTMEKYRLPSGEIVKKYPNPEFKRDNNKLLNWIKSSGLDYVEVKESPKWEELKKVTKVINGQIVTKDGEIVEAVS